MRVDVKTMKVEICQNEELLMVDDDCRKSEIGTEVGSIVRNNNSKKSNGSKPFLHE
jgi:hypothetical protein